MENQTIESVNQILNKSHNVAVIPSVKAGPDAYAAACGLYLALKANDKHPTFIYSATIPEKLKNLINIHEIVTDPSYRELYVTVDFAETPASKVNYEVDDDKLVFKVGPVHKNFDVSKVKSELKGYSFDSAILIGSQNIDDLAQIYNELNLKDGNIQIINIDNSTLNTNFGNANIVDSSKESLSLLMLEFLFKNSLGISTQTAMALLSGMTHRTSL